MHPKEYRKLHNMPPCKFSNLQTFDEALRQHAKSDIKNIIIEINDKLKGLSKLLEKL